MRRLQTRSRVAAVMASLRATPRIWSSDFGLDPANPQQSWLAWLHSPCVQPAIPAAPSKNGELIHRRSAWPAFVSSRHHNSNYSRENYSVLRHIQNFSINTDLLAIDPVSDTLKRQTLTQFSDTQEINTNPTNPHQIHKQPTMPFFKRSNKTSPNDSCSTTSLIKTDLKPKETRVLTKGFDIKEDRKIVSPMVLMADGYMGSTFKSTPKSKSELKSESNRKLKTDPKPKEKRVLTKGFDIKDREIISPMLLMADGYMGSSIRSNNRL